MFRVLKAGVAAPLLVAMSAGVAQADHNVGYGIVEMSDCGGRYCFGPDQFTAAAPVTTRAELGLHDERISEIAAAVQAGAAVAVPAPEAGESDGSLWWVPMPGNLGLPGCTTGVGVGIIYCE